MNKKLVSQICLGTMLMTSFIMPNQMVYAENTDFDNDVDKTIVTDKALEYVPGHVIVGLNEEIAQKNSISELFSDIEIDAIENLKPAMSNDLTPKALAEDEQKVLLIKLKNTEKDAVMSTIEKLKKDPNVKYAEPDYILSIEETIPNDPMFADLYGMKKISAPQAWDIYKGNSSVVVGVIDTGIDYNHEDLKDNMWKNPGEIPGNNVDDDGNGYIDDIYGWDFVNNDNDPMDDNRHGTHCAGTIAGVGNNGIGVTGVSWNAKVAALKFLSGAGSGSTSGAIRAIDYANKMGFPMTSNSWGGGTFNQSLRDIIAEGQLFLAAAGNSRNDNDANPHYPSSYDCENIIAVASTDKDDKLAITSCYGKTTVDLAAPGVKIISSIPGNKYQALSGTSMATPHVAGAAALLKGFKPEYTTAQLKNIILQSVDKVDSLTDKVSTNGRLNVNKMLLGE